jgi:ATP-dependent Clp protease protease subunit
LKKYYSLVTGEKEADIYIFGDITSWEYFENDVSSYTLSKELRELDVDVINIHINSYGGEVAEGLAIYNMLKNHKAKVRTYCDGFACSIASVIFMAGDERIMNNASLLMIHNAWMYIGGNADQLRKTADDLDVITQASVNAYLEKVNIAEEKLKSLLDAETWLLPEEALEMGFANSVVASDQSNKAAANAHKSLFALVKNSLILQEIPKDEGTDGTPEEPEPEPTPDPQVEPEPITENKVMKLFNALLGGKD